MYVGPICPKFYTQIHLGPEIVNVFVFFERALNDMDFKKKFGVKGAWDGIVWGREGEGKGEEGLLNFHIIFQKTWAEPGNPS